MGCARLTRNVTPYIHGGWALLLSHADFTLNNIRDLCTYEKYIYDGFKTIIGDVFFPPLGTITYTYNWNNCLWTITYIYIGIHYIDQPRQQQQQISFSMGWVSRIINIKNATDLSAGADLCEIYRGKTLSDPTTIQLELNSNWTLNWTIMQWV